MQDMPHPNIASLTSIKNKYPKYLNTEEVTKLNLIANYPGTDDIRPLIVRAQEHPLLYGNVHKVIQWCETKDSARFDTERMRQYLQLIYTVWGTDIDSRPDLDLPRRSLLTLRHKGYPILRKSDTVISMCWHDYDWQRLISTAPGAVRQLLDRLISSPHHPSESMKQMCARFADTSYPYYFIIKQPDVLSKCARRSFMRPCSPFIGYHSLDTDHGQCTVWHIGQTKIKADLKIWGEIRAYGSRCLYTDHRTDDISVEIHYRQNGKINIEIFSRCDSDPWHRMPVDLKRLISRLPVYTTYDKKRSRYILKETNEKDGVQLLNTVLSTLQNSH